MDAARALAYLTEISSQIQVVVLLRPDGRLIASTLADEGRAGVVAEAARRLLDAADGLGRGPGGQPLAQLEAATPEGSIFVVRDTERVVAATTSPEPTVGLVFYDLKSCLRSLAAGADGDGRPRPQARQPEGEGDGPP